MQNLNIYCKCHNKKIMKYNKIKKRNYLKSGCRFLKIKYKDFNIYKNKNVKMFCCSEKFITEPIQTFFVYYKSKLVEYRLQTKNYQIDSKLIPSNYPLNPYFKMFTFKNKKNNHTNHINEFINFEFNLDFHKNLNKLEEKSKLIFLLN